MRLIFAIIFLFQGLFLAAFFAYGGARMLRWSARVASQVDLSKERAQHALFWPTLSVIPMLYWLGTAQPHMLAADAGAPSLFALFAFFYALPWLGVIAKSRNDGHRLIPLWALFGAQGYWLFDRVNAAGLGLIELSTLFAGWVVFIAAAAWGLHRGTDKAQALSPMKALLASLLFFGALFLVSAGFFAGFTALVQLGAHLQPPT